MSVQVENLEHNMAKLTIEVAAEELEKALDSAYQKQKKQISVPIGELKENIWSLGSSKVMPSASNLVLKRYRLVVPLG